MEQVPNDIFITYFSNYSAHAVAVGGVVYPTVEHAYHSERYDDADIKRRIREASSPFRAWQISQEYKAQQQPDFADRKVAVMTQLCRLKLQQHEDVRRALVETGERPIIKHITTGPRADGFWDDGEDGHGQNIMGHIWMTLRDDLLRDTSEGVQTRRTGEEAGEYIKQ